MEVRISKEVQFDAGHRVPRHASKCRNPHGHRYRVVAECIGSVIEVPGASDEGMLIDFGRLKFFMTEQIHDVLDHGFIVYEGDSAMYAGLGVLQDLDGQMNVIVFPYIPTAENIARWCFEKLEPLLANHFRDNLRLHSVTVYETPTSMAVYPA